MPILPINMNEFLSQLEQHPVLVTVIISVLGIVGFLIKHFFFNKDKNSAPFIKAGKSITAGGDIIVGNKTVTHNHSAQTPNNIKTFEKHVEESSWSKEFIGNKEVWICGEDNAFQIEIDDKDEEFREKWTKVFPDSNGSGKHEVFLSINGNRIKSHIFVWADGGRILVPLPKTESKDDKVIYYWERNSLDFKIGNIIGNFYIHNNIEGVAKMAGIEIR